MKLSYKITVARILCCVCFSGIVVCSSQTVQAQFPNLNNFRVPRFQNSTPASRASQYLPYIVEAAETLHQVQQERNHQHYQPVPVPVSQPPQVCPQPAPPVSPGPAPEAGSNVEDTKLGLARTLVPRAKQAFAAEDYDRVISILTEVLKLVPEDADAYQFRSLACLAKGEFDRAAADAYDAFRFGNSWTWDTLKSMYPEGQTARYTHQLRKLEEVNKSDERSMSSHFLLAYHYIVLGHLSHAEQQLNFVLEINAEEKLTQQLLSVVKDAQAREQVSQK